MNYRELAVFRPIRLTDIDDLFSLSNKTGIGLTSLPKQKELLLEKIKKSIESFKGNISLKKDCLFLFVLENLSNNKVIGCSGIISVGTDDEPAYYLHVDFNNFLLTLTSHYHGTSELCSLFLDPDYRINNNGKLLSRARLIFLSENKVFKNKQIIAEMRGLFVKENESPFWDYFFKDKLNLTVAEAISLRRTGNKQKIIDLIGKKSISFKNIPDEIKNNIGAVHDETKAAVFLLKQEGFIFNNYIDLIDAGPVIEGEIDNLTTVKNIKIYKVNNIVASDKVLDENKNFNNNIKYYLISNESIKNFRACVSNVILNNKNSVNISDKVAMALEVKTGDLIKTVEL